MLDLAVGVIMGASFGKIVTSLVDDIIMPPVGKIVGGVDFNNRFIDLSLSPRSWQTLAEAKAAGAAPSPRSYPPLETCCSGGAATCLSCFFRCSC